VQTKDPEPVDILTALAENEGVVKNETDPERKAIALAWLFHLVGDIHQPLQTAQLFTVDYPQGDRGGNEICVRVTQAGQPVDLHRFWDGVIASGSKFDTATKRGHCAPKPPRVSAESAHRTCQHRL
jgi:S1/P1 Nuclease